MRKHDDIALIDRVSFFFSKRNCFQNESRLELLNFREKDLTTHVLLERLRRERESTAVISGMRHFIGYFCKLIKVGMYREIERSR